MVSAGSPCCLPVVGEGVEERVGGGVVTLPRRGDRRPCRPEHDEELQSRDPPKASCSTRVPVILGAMTLAKSSSLMFTRSWSCTDPAAWMIPRTGRPPAAVVVVEPGLHLLGVGDVDADGADVRAERVRSPRMAATVAACGWSSVSVGHWSPRRDGAAAQQRDVPGSPLGQVGGHDATERSAAAGDHVRRVGGEFGRERFGRGSAHGRSRGTYVVPPRIAIWSSGPSASRCSQIRAAVRSVGRRHRASMSMRPPQCSGNSWWPMTRPSPQRAAWSTPRSRFRAPVGRCR